MNIVAVEEKAERVVCPKRVDKAGHADGPVLFFGAGTNAVIPLTPFQQFHVYCVTNVMLIRFCPIGTVRLERRDHTNLQRKKFMFTQTKRISLPSHLSFVGRIYSRLYTKKV